MSQFLITCQSFEILKFFLFYNIICAGLSDVTYNLINNNNIKSLHALKLSK